MAKRGNPNWTGGKSGNPKGRPVAPEIQLFRNAIAEVEKKKGKSLLVHAVEKAYVDGPVLIALLKKILPDKIEADIPQMVEDGELKKRILDYLDEVKKK